MPDKIAITNWKPDDLGAVVDFWNRTFADCRNFHEMDVTTFRRRVVEKRTGVEVFRPDGLFLAKVGDRVVGMLHAGRHGEEVGAALEPGWPGGEMGYIALVAVDPEWRRKGIGRALWNEAKEFLHGTTKTVVDGQCINPFYGNSEAPVTPFWGTPEGLSVAEEDEGTKTFFSSMGYSPRFRASHLELDMSDAPQSDVSALEAEIRGRGFEVEGVVDTYPEVGMRLEDTRRSSAGMIYDCLAALDGELVAGVVTTYPMAPLGPGRYAIYEAMVGEEYRERGLGRAMLCLSIERLRAQGAERCEVLTIPEVSERAHALYTSLGFREIAGWLIY